MPGKPREMITMLSGTSPSASGLGDDTLGMRGVLNDAISINFADATLANAFVVPMVRRVRGRGGRRRVPGAGG